MGIIKLGELLKEDFYRYCHRYTLLDLLITYYKVAGFKFCVWYRICAYLGKKKALYLVYVLAFGYYKHISYKFGIDISIHAQIEGGLKIYHYSGIIINSNAIIGKNFTVRPGVVIGNTKEGAPIIGDNVTMGAGAIIIGKIEIGNNSDIGANATVVKDVPRNAVVIGNAAFVHRIKENCEVSDD